MFSKGQLIFAGLFLISFIIAAIYAYRGDKDLHKKFYKGSYKVLIAFILFIISLFIIKLFLKD
jgi:cytochrome bd-type quinol oxidase subunit 1